MPVAVAAFAIPATLLGGLLLLWCRLRYGGRLWPPVLLSCLLTGSLSGLLASAGAEKALLSYLPLNAEARDVAGVVLIGVREEGIKLLLVLAVAWRDPEVRSAADRLMAMTAVALSFAVMENMSMRGLADEPRQLLMFSLTRMLLPAPIHVFASLQVAALVIRARQGSRWWLAALPVPALLHSLWDNPLGAHSETAQVAARLVIEVALFGGAMLLCRGLPVPATRRSAQTLCIVLPAVLVVAAVLDEVLALRGWPYLIAVRPVRGEAFILLPWLAMLADSLLPTFRSTSVQS